MMILPDDVAPSSDSAISPLLVPFEHSFIPGICCKEHQPACSPTTDDQLASSASSSVNTLAVTWHMVKLATASDKVMVQLVSIPEICHKLPSVLRECHQFCKHLYTMDGIILYKDRTVIPPSLEQHDLTVLHSVHQDLISMIACAETAIFWPGITHIIAIQANCHHCNCMEPSQPVLPASPFQWLCANFFHYKGANSLVVVDQYSNWPIIEEAHEGSKGLIDCLKCIFRTFSISYECATDGGTKITTAATRHFLKDWVHH